MKKHELTPRERVKKALEHKEPDRIPFDLGSSKITGISRTAYVRYLEYKGWSSTDPDPAVADVVQQLARVDEGILQRLGSDVRGFLPSLPAAKTDMHRDDRYSYITDEWGIKWKMPLKDGFYYDLAEHPLSGPLTLSGLNGYNWPEPLVEARTAHFEKDMATAKSAGEYAFIMHGISAGILEMSLRLRGFENYFMDLALEPGLACSLLDRVTDTKIAFWDAALEKYGSELLVAVEADDLGTQNSLLISPEMYRKYIMPRHKRLFSFIKRKAPHIKVFIHSCGAIRPLIPDLVEAGVDILNPVQVSAGGMDTRALKKEFGDVITFWGGGIDTQEILPRGTPGQVRDEVKRRIEDLAPGGGFVFSTVHNIQADVSPQNIEAMLEALREYGNY